VDGTKQGRVHDPLLWTLNVTKDLQAFLLNDMVPDLVFPSIFPVHCPRDKISSPDTRFPA